MNINKNTWHYKLLRDAPLLNPWTPSSSLCVYFWQVVARILCLTVASIVSVSLVTALFMIILSPVITLVVYFIGQVTNEGLNLWAFTGVVVIILLLLELLVHGLDTLVKYLRHRAYTAKPKAPNILTSYIKAKKEKVCPIITFTQED
jgi:hypothetical protein